MRSAELEVVSPEKSGELIRLAGLKRTRHGASL